MKRRESVKKSVGKHEFETAESRVSKENKENIESVNEMITLLREYELMCISKQDFVLAEEAKNKIQLLKGQTAIMRHENMQTHHQEAIGLICKQGEEEVKSFQEFWDAEIQRFLDGLKEIQDNLISEHKTQLSLFKHSLNEAPVPRIKLSAKTLELRSHLSNLIKARKYKEAEEIKNKLKEMQIHEEQKWIEKFNEKKITQIQNLQKKQSNELQALRIRLEGAFNQKIKERDRKFQIYQNFASTLGEDKPFHQQQIFLDSRQIYAHTPNLQLFFSEKPKMHNVDLRLTSLNTLDLSSPLLSTDLESRADVFAKLYLMEIYNQEQKKYIKKNSYVEPQVEDSVKDDLEEEEDPAMNQQLMTQVDKVLQMLQNKANALAFLQFKKNQSKTAVSAKKNFQTLRNQIDLEPSPKNKLKILMLHMLKKT